MTARGPIQIELHPCDKPHEYDQLIESLAAFLGALDDQRRRDLAPRGTQSIGEALVATVESALGGPQQKTPRVRSDETRARMAAAMRASWARRKGKKGARS